MSRAAEFRLTEALTVPDGLDLGNRPRAPKRLRGQPAAHAQMAAMAGEAPQEREAGLLIGSRQWPLLRAARRHLLAGSHRHQPWLAASWMRLSPPGRGSPRVSAGRGR
ncbi:hypothetical protein [Streptomyces yangpuensis]|uniref:hypothetical protein n=1 Tax=Streptomyces yangpuensis TaxID=1648182 RepID=UPI0036AB1DDB